MGVEFYKGFSIPVFESTIAHSGKFYGLASGKSSESYYLFDVNQTPMKCIMHFQVVKGTILKLGIGSNNELGVHCFSKDGNDEGFMALPL